MKSYTVGNTTYQFPDEYDDGKVQSILMQQGIIKDNASPQILPVEPGDVQGTKDTLQARYGDILNQNSDPSNLGIAKEVAKGVLKNVINPLGIGTGTNSPLVASGPGQEFGADIASAPAVASGIVGGAKSLATAGRVLSNPVVRDKLAKVIPKGEQAADAIKTIRNAVAEARGQELAAQHQAANPPRNITPIAPQNTAVPMQGIPATQTPTGRIPGGPQNIPMPPVRRPPMWEGSSVPPPSPTPNMQGIPAVQTPTGRVPGGPQNVPPVTPPPNRPPLWNGMPNQQPPATQNIRGIPAAQTPTGRVPGGIQNMQPIPQKPPVLNTGQPIPTPSTAPPPSGVPDIPSTTASSPVLNTAPAAEALRESLVPGSSPGKVATIPGSDTEVAGSAAHEANSFLKGLREKTGAKTNGDLAASIKDPNATRAAILSKNPSPEAATKVFKELGIEPQEPNPLPGGELPKFAKGGVVVPSKAEVPEMARSGEDVIRGSSDIPLSSKGKEQAKELGDRFKAKGGMDHLETSDLHRAVQTAEAISKATGIPISNKSKELHPWHLGEIEGQPTTKILDRIHRYITKQPNVKVPGQGPQSTAPGESFNSFKRRFLGALRDKLKELRKDPSKRFTMVTHYRDVRIAQAWASKGFPDSMEINSKFMTEKGNDPPGSVFRLHWKGTKPVMEKVNMNQGGKLLGGVYLVRHGVTSWNEEAYNGKGETK